MSLQSIFRIHLPFKMPMRNFSVLLQAPLSSMAATTCVTFGFQDSVMVAPVKLANSDSKSYKSVREIVRYSQRMHK